VSFLAFQNRKWKLAGGAGITIVGTSFTNSLATSETVTVTLPAGISSGDRIQILVLAVANQKAVTLSGYTYTNLPGSNAFSDAVSMFVKTAAGTESSTNVTITHQSPTISMVFAVIIRGTSGLGATPTSASTSGTTVTAPSITATAGSMVQSLFTMWQSGAVLDSGTATLDVASPGGYWFHMILKEAFGVAAGATTAQTATEIYAGDYSGHTIEWLVA